MNSTISTVYDAPEENESLIPVLTHTRDIWDNHLPRFIRFQALEVIFRNACKTKKYQYALECFEIYKRNRDKKKEKENDYTKFLKKRLFPLYVRLAYATSSK